MGEPSLYLVTKEWSSAIATVKLLAETPDAVDVDSTTALKLIWSAALGNRDKVNLPDLDDLPEDTQLLLYLADNKQLAEHVAKAATKAVVALGKQIKQAASAPATSSSAAASDQQDASATAAAVPRVTKAVILPAVQLLTTYAAVLRAWLNHPKFTRDMFGQMAIKVMPNFHLQSLLGLLNTSDTLQTARLEVVSDKQQQCETATSSTCSHLCFLVVLQMMIIHQLEDTGRLKLSISVLVY
jgi:hypothetical protein